MLMSSLSQSYDHLVTTIMYEKKTLELKDVRQMLQSNKLMNKIDKIEKASVLIVKEQKRRSHSKEPKKKIKASSGNNDCYYCKQTRHMKKNCFKYKRC